MAIRPIVKWPDPRLRQETKQVTSFDETIRNLCKDLEDTMIAAKGLGIAAIQIGVPKSIFMIDASIVENRDNPLIFINPEIITLGDELEELEEGCLSFPSVYVKIKRPMDVHYKAMDLEGNSFDIEATDMLARAIQHEHDHLTGKLLVDFAGPLKTRSIRRTMKQLNTDGTEYISTSPHENY